MRLRSIFNEAGGRSLEDLRELRREAGLRRMGDPQTGQAGLVGLGQVRDTVNARLLRRDGHETYTLDVDATLIEGEKRDAHWSYQGVRGVYAAAGVSV